MFLGFVMSMVFAHAPVIVPAVLRVELAYSRGLYAQLVLLHVSLAVRLIGGELAGDTALWQWGGVGNEAAILLFVTMTALAVARARAQARRARAAIAQRGRSRSVNAGTGRAYAGASSMRSNSRRITR